MKISKVDSILALAKNWNTGTDICVEPLGAANLSCISLTNGSKIFLPEEKIQGRASNNLICARDSIIRAFRTRMAEIIFAYWEARKQPPTTFWITVRMYPIPQYHENDMRKISYEGIMGMSAVEYSASSMTHNYKIDDSKLFDYLFELGDPSLYPPI